jgi:predicted nucleotidyltransferase
MNRADKNIPHELIADFCRRHSIARLSLFGSILRDDFGPDSDVDVLVEFIAGATPGLFRFAGMEMELSQLLGRTVHLCTPADLSKYFREQVLREARLQYAA